MLTAQ